MWFEAGDRLSAQGQGWWALGIYYGALLPDEAEETTSPPHFHTANTGSPFQQQPTQVRRLFLAWAADGRGFAPCRPRQGASRTIPFLTTVEYPEMGLGMVSETSVRGFC